MIKSKSTKKEENTGGFLLDIKMVKGFQNIKAKRNFSQMLLN